MKYENDFEAKSMTEVPMVVNSAVKARTCINCGKHVFANYEFLDYVCLSCRGIKS